MSVLESTPAAPQRVQSLKRKRTSPSSTPVALHDKSPLISTPSSSKRTKAEAATKTRSLQPVRTLEWIQQSTLQALENHLDGNDALYENLRQKFSLNPSRNDDYGPVTSEELRKWVIAIATYSHAMGRDSGSLLSSMLHCRWLERDDGFLADFQSFLVSLLSAHGGYVPHVLKWLIGNFANVPAHISQIPEVTLVTRETVFDRLHETIQLIMSTIPASLGIMTSSISNCFPFSLSHVQSYTDYVKNLFRLMSYDKTLEPTILGLIMEHLVGIDVHVGIELEELDEDDIAGLMEQVRDDTLKLESGELETDDDEDLELSPHDKAEEAALKATIQALMKLDIVLDLLFRHFNTIIESEKPDSSFLKTQQLVSMFINKILVTYNSRHCQFLVFRFGQLNPQIFETFMSEMIKVAFDRNRALPIRCSAVTYLASYAARGSKLTGDVVLRMFGIFHQELERLRTTYEQNGVRHPDPDRYRLYYTLFQACMYLFCFRWRDFVLNPDQLEDHNLETLKWLPTVKATFTQNVHCATNPLKVCSQIIVNQFAYVASSLKFLFIDDLIEQNKRVRLTRVISANTVARESTLMSGFTERTLQLEAHYPFEPFALPRSRMWVDGLYQEFVDPNGDDESSDEEDEE